MKKLLLLSSVIVGMATGLYANTIVLWDFNSLVNDFTPTTGTFKPNGGFGTPARTVGGVGNRIGTVAASATTDSNTGDNSQWRVGTNLGNDSFPTATNANKTTGAEFHVNSSGYTNIHVTWDQENSSSASRYWRVQYTTNG